MKILVTAGNTQTPIDQVRCITNIFSGRTGTRIALEAHDRGHEVCLLTSHPEVVADCSTKPLSQERWRVRAYKTFDDLRDLMKSEIVTGGYDAVLHVAAVSDYEAVGVYALSDGVNFDVDARTLRTTSPSVKMADVRAGKVKGNHEELWLRLTPTPKLVDFIRKPWDFRGILVKFKLEVNVCEASLQSIADASRRQSQADMIVANTLEGMASWALIGTDSGFQRTPPHELPSRVARLVEEHLSWTSQPLTL